MGWLKEHKTDIEIVAGIATVIALGISFWGNTVAINNFIESQQRQHDDNIRGLISLLEATSDELEINIGRIDYLKQNILNVTGIFSSYNYFSTDIMKNMKTDGRVHDRNLIKWLSLSDNRITSHTFLLQTAESVNFYLIEPETWNQRRQKTFNDWIETLDSFVKPMLVETKNQIGAYQQCVEERWDYTLCTNVCSEPF